MERTIISYAILCGTQDLTGILSNKPLSSYFADMFRELAKKAGVSVDSEYCDSLALAVAGGLKPGVLDNKLLLMGIQMIPVLGFLGTDAASSAIVSFQTFVIGSIFARGVNVDPLPDVSTFGKKILEEANSALTLSNLKIFFETVGGAAKSFVPMKSTAMEPMTESSDVPVIAESSLSESSVKPDESVPETAVPSEREDPKDESKTKPESGRFLSRWLHKHPATQESVSPEAKTILDAVEEADSKGLLAGLFDRFTSEKDVSEAPINQTDKKEETPEQCKQNQTEESSEMGPPSAEECVSENLSNVDENSSRTSRMFSGLSSRFSFRKHADSDETSKFE